jgi:squalene synthase HpnC
MYRRATSGRLSMECMRPRRADAEGTVGPGAASAGVARVEAHGDARAEAPPGRDGDEYLRGREREENFPVALRLLPADVRTHLRRIYDVARVIDDLGDEASGDRMTRLVEFRADLDTIWAGGQPGAPVLRELAVSVQARGLSRQPFADLIEANLLDQKTSVYPTYDDLLAYCRLSANPIGRMVLEVFGVSTPERVGLSDRICTALQIIEHCQDVAEDYRAGRIYLPLADLERFGVAREQLGASAAGPALRRLVAFEARCASELLESGRPLLRELPGWARIAVAGYMAGGQAAVMALRRGQWAVLPSAPRRRRLDVGAALIANWTRAALPRPVWPRSAREAR